MTTRLNSTVRNANPPERAPSRTVTRDPGGAIMTATTISFTAGATIADSGNGMARFPVGQELEVRGSALNNRRFRVTAGSAASVTVVPAVVRTEAAGATVTILTVEN